MDRIEWDALGQPLKNQMVAACLGGWSRPRIVILGSNEWERLDNEEEALYRNKETGVIIDSSAILWLNPQGEPTGTCHIPHYTTDRNDCALVINEIYNRELEEAYFCYLMNVLFGQHCWLFDFQDDLMALMNVQNADPDTICYAAVKAVEEAQNAKSDS